MSENNHGELREQLANTIRENVRAGFSNPSEILEQAGEFITDNVAAGDSEGLRAEAVRLLESAIAQQRAAQAQWPAVTDFDRLDAAFKSLEAEGIVCRHNFSCCGNCASAEIWDEITAQRNLGREIRGCAHYHMQDTESAVGGHGLYLSFGTVLRSEQAAVEIGHEIVAALHAQGLETSWDGTLQRRIFVRMDWKRRLPETF